MLRAHLNGDPPANFAMLQARIEAEGIVADADRVADARDVLLTEGLLAASRPRP